MSRLNSISTRMYLSLGFVVLLFFVIVILTLYIFRDLRNWGVTIDEAGVLRYNALWAEKSALLYHEHACVLKKDSKAEVEQIQKSKNIVATAIQNFKEGKNGVKSIKEIDDVKLTALFSELETLYPRLFEQIDTMMRTCDEKLLDMIDETTNRILSISKEFVPIIANKSKREMIMFEIILFVVLTVVLILFSCVSFFTKKNYKDGLTKAIDTMKELERGNLAIDISKAPFREFDGLYSALTSLKKFMEGLIYAILISTKSGNNIINRETEEIEELIPVTNQISSLAEKAGIVGSEVSDLLSQIERATEEMKIAISEISKNTHETADRSRLVKEVAHEMEVTVLELNKSMDEIRSITETIKGIAEQTNLLALNASIEAARAGEAGKGFAVVANEVKELAKKVTDFTGEIEKIVDHLSQKVNETVSKAEKTKEMVEDVEKATTMIAGAVEEQTSVTNEIVNYTINTKDRSFGLTQELEDLKRVVEKLNRVSFDLKIGSKVLLEINNTNQMIGDLFHLDAKTLTDAELAQMHPSAIINLAILGHINWKMNFIDQTVSGKVPNVERDHRKCLLGRSMEILREKLKGSPCVKALDELEGPHRELHGLVERFEREVNRKSREDIWKFIDEEVFPVFNKVISMLYQLQSSCRIF